MRTSYLKLMKNLSTMMGTNLPPLPLVEPKTYLTTLGMTILILNPINQLFGDIIQLKEGQNKAQNYNFRIPLHYPHNMAGTTCIRSKYLPKPYPLLLTIPITIVKEEGTNSYKHDDTYPDTFSLTYCSINGHEKKKITITNLELNDNERDKEKKEQIKFVNNVLKKILQQIYNEVDPHVISPKRSCNYIGMGPTITQIVYETLIVNLPTLYSK